MDEVPGSSIQFADIRNAVNGIEILGQPAHSPLLGEITEVDVANEDRANAQVLGNILSADRGAVSLTGSISSVDDIDWYEFEVQLEGIQRIAGGPNAAPIYAGITIDMDFTDGLARPNTAIHIFNEAGNLVFSSLDSSIPDDQPAIAGSGSLTDLSTGSAGSRDPFLGTVELQEGTYFMAVTSPSYRYAGLDDNPLLRREPINSLVRVAEDRIGFSGGSNIAEGPQVPILFTDNFSLYAPEVAQLKDGETFSITDGLGNSVTYEFDNNNSVRGLNVPIPYDDSSLLLGDTPASLAATISQAITANGPAGVTVGGLRCRIGRRGGAARRSRRQSEAGARFFHDRPVCFQAQHGPILPGRRDDVRDHRLGSGSVAADHGRSVYRWLGEHRGHLPAECGRFGDQARWPTVLVQQSRSRIRSDANTGNYLQIDPQSLATQDLSHGDLAMMGSRPSRMTRRTPARSPRRMTACGSRGLRSARWAIRCAASRSETAVCCFPTAWPVRRRTCCTSSTSTPVLPSASSRRRLPTGKTWSGWKAGERRFASVANWTRRPIRLDWAIRPC